MISTLGFLLSAIRERACQFTHRNRHLTYQFIHSVLCPLDFRFQPPVDGYLTDVVDDDWRTDQLPHDPIWVPTEKLPDPEADNGDSHLTLSEQVSASPSLPSIERSLNLSYFAGTTLDGFGIGRIGSRARNHRSN